MGMQKITAWRNLEKLLLWVDTIAEKAAPGKFGQKLKNDSQILDFVALRNTVHRMHNTEGLLKFKATQ